MKKILPLLLLLLLLIIYCVWTKKDSIHLTTTPTSTTNSTTPNMVKEAQEIEYTIAQHGSNYTLNGNFTNTQQQDSLRQTFQNAHKQLRIENTTSNQTLEGNNVIAFTNTILPHFIQNYHNGKIVYNEKKLTLYGTTNSYEVQHEMQRLLNKTTISTQDNTSVVQIKPITYLIHKDDKVLILGGIFNNQAQVDVITAHVPASAKTSFNIQSNCIDNGSLKTLNKFLPLFLKKYTFGDIRYSGETLEISGHVRSENDLKEITTLLKNTEVPLTNHTIIDPLILMQLKQKELATLANEKLEQERLAKIEEAKKAEKAQNLAKAATQDAQKATENDATPSTPVAHTSAEEEAKRAELALAATPATQKAQEAAQRKAEEEAAQKIAEEAKKAEEAQRQAKLAAQKATEEAKKTEMKAKILNLFKLGHIEFNVNKSTLTQKGKSTVDKLARILKEFASVKIEIAGHTDADGSAKYNQKLSQSRVDMVRSRLINQSINPQRLKAVGYGESKPLVPNDTRENKAKNRRVEIIILGE